MEESDPQVIEGGIYGRNREALREAVEKALPFRNGNGNVNGFHGRHHGIGRLNDTEAQQYRQDDVVFTITSFDTPIAWLRSDGTAHYVGQYFSPTTARHLAAVQGLGKQRTPKGTT